MVTPVRPRVYLDANVFIAAFETQGAHSDHAWWILNAIEGGDLFGVTSELTLAEILVGPMQDGDDELVQRYQDIISPAECFEVGTVTRAVLIEAGTLRSARRAMRLPDAIHVASARIGGCRFIVSDDRRMSFAPEMQVVPLGPFALDIIRADRP
ncbi:MAG: type II toxin-antitoxin system VapC family toxin [Xanthobacteraceae bacterium]